jgi:hypothetical protein
VSLIACYCEENQRARLESVLGPNARCSSNWRSFEAAAAGAYCVVVARQWMSDTAFVEPLRALRASIPSAPFVIVTDSSVENLTLLGRVGFDRLVQFDRLAEELPAAVHEFVDEKPRAWLIRAVSNLEPLPEGFRAGLIEELRRDRAGKTRPARPGSFSVGWATAHPRLAACVRSVIRTAARLRVPPCL